MEAVYYSYYARNCVIILYYIGFVELSCVFSQVIVFFRYELFIFVGFANCADVM